MTDMTQPVSASSKMILTLGLVAALSGFLVVFVFQYTKPYIDENKRLAIEQAVLQVIPGAISYQPYALEGDQLVNGTASGSGLQIYAGYDPEQQFIGIAAGGAAQGYQDKIQLIYGYKPACECITGIKVIKLAETPGLGDKIITDKNFVGNFKALEARLNYKKDGLENAIVAVKHGTKINAWQIDSISGATISSVAVGKAINNSAQVILPAVSGFLEQLKEHVHESNQ